MTKPITALTAMQLLERKEIRLEDPVSKYIPEYGNLMAWENGRARKAKNEMTLRMLLNMTSGLSYLEEDMDRGQTDFIRRWKQDDQSAHPWDTMRVAKELAGIPLKFEPGTQYEYGLSLDVMGAIIEVVSGQNLNQYCKENIFDPLGMKATAWKLAPEDEGRLAKCYKRKAGSLIADGESSTPVLNRMDWRNPRYYSGGAGVLSTLPDYSRFARMLLRNGELDGARIIGEDFIQTMHLPQLDMTQLADFRDMISQSQGLLHNCYSYGYGVRTMVNLPEGCKTTDGEWGWGGALGTWLSVDPLNGLWIVYMQQGLPCNHRAYIPNLYHAVYSALE